ncbi:predicted protein [Nematostella vectensis]|uniref:PX domain-containing protein n=1 Tax=Nematostella vectensis TaxID=45351 RepID=A7SXV9_NEMVE|nr:predicted protein [Nematostella vectensis]|eukprot:XP_001623560.1 predicted protein [Nematostella vectensis]
MRPVSRRFKHFDWLYNRLVDKYTLIAIPPLPDKQITGRFGEDFVEKRREKLEKWVGRLCQHPVLSKSPVVNHFLTCADSEKEWKAGKRKAENDKFTGGAFFRAVECPPTKLSLYAIDSHIDNFGKFVRSMEDSVKNIVDRGTTHCEKCIGSYKTEYKKIGGTFTGLSQSFAVDDITEIRDCLDLRDYLDGVRLANSQDKHPSSMQEYIFRGPNGRFCETFAPTTSLCEVYETLSHRVGAKVAGLLVGFPPQSVPGETLEGVETNEVITIVEGHMEIVSLTSLGSFGRLSDGEKQRYLTLFSNHSVDPSMCSLCLRCICCAFRIV